ncbi:MAG: hypothetical protein P9E88_06425 [Candidatus Competibacter sp.]|nr:hypothetical protein [Candidatus Competibacter sp.]
MTLVPIPAWNAQGVIPPINALNPTSVERSPYTVSLIDFVDQFSTSPERRNVLQGFLRYRLALHSAGLTQGFQWLNGSFLEDVETLEGRAPRDLDVVTFYRLPAGQSQQDVQLLAPHLFPINRTAQEQLKANFHVDAYLVHLGMIPERLVERSTYWYSLWSHRRNQLWKGYVQINLAPTEDAAAWAAMAGLGNPGAQP